MEVRQLLKDSGFHFSKSLGQNFLTDLALLDSICECAGVEPSDDVLEIGPGAGTLTRSLSAHAHRVVAVEIDRALEPVLGRMLAGMDNVELRFGDILKLDVPQLTKEAFPGRFMVVANLPYYITTPVVMRLLETELPLFRITVMVQKEVADRMVAAPGTKAYGALSVAVQYRAHITVPKKVPAGAFYPKPSVDSALVRMDIYDEKPVQPNDEALFLRIARAAFAMRRKTMANNLVAALGIQREEAERALEHCGHSRTVRGETLGVKELAQLADVIPQYGKPS